MHLAAKCIFIGLCVQLAVGGGSGIDSSAHSGSGHGGYGYSGYGLSGYAVSTDYVSRYHGPGAVPVVLHDGTLANTPEVAAARIAHLTALQKAQALWYGSGSAGSDYSGYGSHSGSQSGSYSGSHAGSYSGSYARDASWVGGAGATAAKGGAWPSYNGPLASVTVLPSGYLADSPSVASARLAHVGAVAQAYSEAAKWPAESGYNKGWN